MLLYAQILQMTTGIITRSLNFHGTGKFQNERRESSPASHRWWMSDSSDEEPQHLQYKVILIGDGAVGKTSIAHRICDDTFATSYKQTFGLDFYMKTMEIKGTKVALQVWDIGGQQLGGKMLSKYIFGTHAVILCYDVTNLQSFSDLDDWLTMVNRTFGENPLPLLVLLGNKSDINHMREVRLEKHTAFSKENSTLNFFVSAKTGDNINLVFTRIAAELANINLNRTELEAETTVLAAGIVDHAKDDPALPAEPVNTKKKKKGGCSIQ